MRYLPLPQLTASGTTTTIDATLNDQRRINTLVGISVFVVITFIIAVISSSQTTTTQQPTQQNDNNIASLAETVIANQPHTQTIDIPCIPQTCFTPIHFIKDANGLADPLAFVALSSFPGAGNTWTRSVIEEGTRIYSGSVYHDADLYAAGFRGEMEVPWPHKHSRVSVIKFHWPFFDIGIPQKISSAIHVVRAPFDAILSDFNREYGGGHVGVATDFALESRRFRQHADLRIAAWIRDMDAWMGVRFWQDANWKQPTGSGNILQRQVHVADEHAIPVLIVFYEDLVRDFTGTSRIMFDFLKSQFLGEVMPSVDDAVTCAVVGFQRELAERRNHTTSLNPYDDPQSSVSKIHRLKFWCDKLKDYWWVEKWGSCEDGMQQLERKGGKRVPLPNVGKDKCM